MSPCQPVKIALLGVGRWGNHLLRNLLAHPQAEVVAIVDPDADRLERTAHQFELDHSLLISDWATALEVPGLEAIVVATPAATHDRLIRAALQRKLHVLAEKPLTLDPLTALELCCLAEVQQRQLVIDHTYLFHPAVSRGRAVIQQEQLGELRYGYASRTHLGPVRSDVDALWDLAIHDIAIFNHWLNQVPIQVQAQGKVWLQANGSDSSTTGDRLPQSLSDLVWVKLLYPCGFQASLHLCWSNPDKQRRLCAVGDRGTLVFDELSDAPLTLLQGRLELQQQHYTPIEQVRRVLDLAPIEPLQAVCTHFLNCVQTHSPSTISSGWLGAELVQILAALTRSLNQGGQPVTLALRQP
ncbi:Gfo/Idh/MocA family oxidoreductase [Phormidium tenue FACHB-886]|nr:Gfo/Idh/MocA family oxidoreductase [Phormidium tenue FACHB-886]